MIRGLVVICNARPGDGSASSLPPSTKVLESPRTERNNAGALIIRIGFWRFIIMITYSLHCSSFLGLPLRILNIDLVKPKKGSTMESIGMV